MNPLLSSLSNPKIKYLLSLEKARERKKSGQFVIEGLRELTLAKESKYAITQVFYCPDIIGEADLLATGLSNRELLPVHQSIFNKLAYRETTGGVVAIAEQKENKLKGLKLRANPMILIVESVEKPGNLGALLRTADAAGLDAVISCDPKTDFYNPNTIRSSLGCVFTNQIATATSQEAIEWLKSHQLKIFCTYLEASIPYSLADFTQPCAIVMGSEADGLTDIWIENADANIIIPMKGKIDSMNVSVSAAIVVFEALRQRALVSP